MCLDRYISYNISETIVLEINLMKIKISKYRSIYIIIFYAVLALLMYLTIRAKFVWYGDDTYYHFIRIMGLSDNFKQGMLQSGVTTNFFGKIGYGVNIFYPWITLIPFTFFEMLTNSWIQAYYLGLMFYFFISFLISHYAMKQFSGNTFQAIIFAVIYGFSTYRLIDFFSRAALAEYISTVFLPLCFLGFYNLFFGDGKNWKPLAIGMSMIILSHILTTFMCVLLFIVILIIFYAKVKLDKSRVINFFKAVGMTILATLIFTVPFIAEETFQKYGMPSPQKLQGKSLLSLVKASFMNVSGRQYEGFIYNIGLVLILALIVGAVLFRKFDASIKGIFILAVLTFFMSSSFFPWKLLEMTPVKVIQFPFRNLMFATLFAAVVASKCLVILVQNSRINVIVAIVAMTFLSAGLWYHSFNRALVGSYISQKNLLITEEMADKGRIPENYLDQYVPKKSQDDLTKIEQHEGYINDKTFNQIPGIQNGKNYFEIKNVKKGDVLDLPYIRYRFTRILLNDEVGQLLPSKRGTVKFVAPKNFDKLRIQISYDVPAFQLLFILSALAWLILIVI